MEPPELRNFYLATQNLREAMQRDIPLTDFDLISLENYIALLQITSTEWKRRNFTKPTFNERTLHQTPNSFRNSSQG
jgi:hypothetical protein